MKQLLFLLLLLFCILNDSHGASMSNLIEIACKRNPKLKICPPETKNNQKQLPPLPPLLKSELSSKTLPGNITRSEFILLRQLAEQTKKVRNPFSEEDNFKLDEDLVDFESHESSKNREEIDDSVFSRTGHFVKAPAGEGSRVEVYCEKYYENYAYYCGDSIDKVPSLKEHLYKFCPSYEINCPDKTAQIPKQSFTLPALSSSSSGGSSDFPDISHIQQSPEEIEAEKKLAALKKARPCTPDCDHRIYKHCTAECKCDYIYPVVQRFCNPPPIPFFLNTCRLWYYGCPKYQQYHYASQFVYSKAEKGKTVAGLAPPRTGSFGGATPGGFSSPVGRGGLAGPVTKGELTSPVRPEKAKQLVNKQTSPPDPFEATKEKFLRDHNISPKARQIPQSPVVPTDAAFQGDNFHQFDGYTNNNGVLFRPRSRSPFSKPGLWEPNPDDPHNRDHANKWYYHPESVGVDWLSGQITWGAHWAVPAAGVGGTDGFSAVHFPTIGNFLNIADDYD